MTRRRRTVIDIPPRTARLAVVTDANSGIGWYTALELARAGSGVVVAALRVAALLRVDAHRGEGVEVVTADASRSSPRMRRSARHSPWPGVITSVSAGAEKVCAYASLPRK